MLTNKLHDSQQMMSLMKEKELQPLRQRHFPKLWMNPNSRKLRC